MRIRGLVHDLFKNNHAYYCIVDSKLPIFRNSRPTERAFRRLLKSLASSFTPQSNNATGFIPVENWPSRYADSIFRCDVGSAAARKPPG